MSLDIICFQKAHSFLRTSWSRLCPRTNIRYIFVPNGGYCILTGNPCQVIFRSIPAFNPGIRKSQKGREIVHPMTPILLAWTAQKMCVVASSEGGLGAMSKNILKGLNLRVYGVLTLLLVILSWFCFK